MQREYLLYRHYSCVLVVRTYKGQMFLSPSIKHMYFRGHMRFEVFTAIKVYMLTFWVYTCLYMA